MIPSVIPPGEDGADRAAAWSCRQESNKKVETSLLVLFLCPGGPERGGGRRRAALLKPISPTFPFIDHFTEVDVKPPEAAAQI